MKAFRFRGDLERDEAAVTALWERGCQGVQQDGAEVVGYFEREVALPFGGRWEDADDTDWVARYQQELRPVPLGTLVIAPTHAEVTLRSGQKPLWLDPGSAFGSGHHETTRMALLALEAFDPAGRRVLDVGAGSGILAIAADLLGAADAVGVDVDAATLRVARENARLNRSRARFREGSVEAAADLGAPAVLVANLYAELHAELLGAYRAAVAPGAKLALTGILREREAVVERALPPGLRPLGWWREGEWSLLRLEAA